MVKIKVLVFFLLEDTYGIYIFDGKESFEGHICFLRYWNAFQLSPPPMSMKLVEAALPTLSCTMSKLKSILRLCISKNLISIL